METLSALARLNISHITRRGISCTAVTHGGYPYMQPHIGKKESKDIRIPSPIAMSVGNERYEWLAKVKGIKDPFREAPSSIMKDSTAENPNMVPSVEPERVMGCLCEPDAFSFVWWTLTAGEPQRCKCGHWFKLVPAEPLGLNI